jgi:hypothetical protein
VAASHVVEGGLGGEDLTRRWALDEEEIAQERDRDTGLQEMPAQPRERGNHTGVIRHMASRP